MRRVFVIFLLMCVLVSKGYYFEPDEFISTSKGTVKRSFRYFPTTEDIYCETLDIINTTGVKIISSRLNNVCVGNQDGIGFVKNYYLGKYENYFLQYTGSKPQTLKSETVSTNTVVVFKSDIALENGMYESFKYVPMVYNITCNNLFDPSYMGLEIKINKEESCVRGPDGFYPNLVLEKYKTYSVVLPLDLEKFEVNFTAALNIFCENTCVGGPRGLDNNGFCQDGGSGSDDGSCQYGTDCADCGPRIEVFAPSPPPPPLQPLPPQHPPPPARPPPPSPLPPNQGNVETNCKKICRVVVDFGTVTSVECGDFDDCQYPGNSEQCTSNNVLNYNKIRLDQCNYCIKPHGEVYDYDCTVDSCDCPYEDNLARRA